LIEGASLNRLHFAGILGSGMSAIAQYLSWQGMKITGSDRLFGLKDAELISKKLVCTGCKIYPQDGSGISPLTQALVVSTAIEESNPEIIKAKNLKIPVFHRSDILAAIVRTKKTIAVCGTSGKSTVTAMIFELLNGCRRKPSLISGAELVCLKKKGLLGNAFRGESDLLVIEADESDGTLIKYKPAISVFLNVSKDHKSIRETMGFFKSLAESSQSVIVNADDSLLLNEIGHSVTFGTSNIADYRPDQVLQTAPFVRFKKDKNIFTLNHPGEHNLSNVLAALCVCHQLGCKESELMKAVKKYKGVNRRFQIVKLKNGAYVVDDYAHNPAKIKATLNTAHDMYKKLFVIFQPHGFGPTRFLRKELVQVFTENLKEKDELYILPIYYAGGTAQKDISSKDIVTEIARMRVNSFAPLNRNDLFTLPQKTKRGDAIIVMGARDPTLSAYIKKIINS
jgi:UDP-N-acetylmuramate--alanine ligase